jgi:hypothetical protein
VRQAWAAAAVLAAGCNEFGLDPIDNEEPPSRVVVVEEFVQRSLPSVDLLFVVDNTASMAQEQDRLADQFGALSAQLASADVDWQVGVVTTDVGGVDAGWLQGSPYVITAGVEDALDKVASAVLVGTEGSGPEAGFAAATLALQLSGDAGPNHGFRRADASLHVVFVSDADDDSQDWFGEDPVAPFLSVLAAEADATGLPVVASAVVGDLPDGCSTGKTSAQPGFRYAEVAGESGGRFESICTSDFSGLLAAIGDASIVWPLRFELGEQPVAGSVTVEIDGDRMADGWALEASPPAVVFDEPPAPSARIRVSFVVELT